MRRILRHEQQRWQRYYDLQTGTVVQTSYGTGPYEVVSIAGPWRVTQYVDAIEVWPYPVISLTCVIPHPQPYARGLFYLNCLHRDVASGIWRNQHGGQITVLRQPVARPVQMCLFVEDAWEELRDPVPYIYAPDVDYRATSAVQAWHCGACGHDWNVARDVMAARCPWCPQHPVGLRVFVREPFERL